MTAAQNADSASGSLPVAAAEVDPRDHFGPPTYAGLPPYVDHFDVPAQWGPDAAESHLPAESQLPAETPLPSESHLPAGTPLPSESPLPTENHLPDGTHSAPTRVLPAIPAASVTPEPAKTSTAPARVAAAGHPVSINCPDCGASAMVELTRRDALDFCPRCDFPLFWARDQVVFSEPADTNDDSLRRLPGTLGRVVIASVPCPHCNEPNLPVATLCVRCGLSMQASAPPSPPPPRPAPPLPEPPLEPLEDAADHWWIWLLVLLTLLLVAGIVLLAARPWQ